MKNYDKKQLIELLTMPYCDFESSLIPEAKDMLRSVKGDAVTAVAMLGFTNICKNNCLYCGMRAACKIPRYRIAPEDAVRSAETAAAQGFKRIFLISGEDLGYGYDNILTIIKGAKKAGLYVTLACGEFVPEQYVGMKAAGADEYVLKFEMSDPETFDRLNPSTSFERRMHSIEAVQASGMKLASGNIVDFPGHSIEQMADDILLMKKLGISWAPVVPYMPAMNTPLAALGGRGDYRLNLREIAILRLMMPEIDITAQQPGDELKNGFADEQGNLLALAAGANMLFADLLPDAQAKNFSVIDNRSVLDRQRIISLAAKAGMKCDLS